ncbi:hypothetical protein Pd630_LPD04678 [Rhodococcus opacus PD630]|nr:hypothetical protein Pd630_LPD04678 [Rhodococcus opacus PD630]
MTMGALPFCRLLVGLSEPFLEFRGCPMTVAFAGCRGSAEQGTTRRLDTAC